MVSERAFQEAPWPTLLVTQKSLRRSFPEANSPARKTSAFALILREGTPTETLFRPLGGT